MRHKKLLTEDEETGAIMHAGKIAAAMALGFGILFPFVASQDFSAIEPADRGDDTAARGTFSLNPPSLGNPLVASALQLINAALPTTDEPSVEEGNATRDVAEGELVGDPIYSWTLDIKRGDALMPKLVDAGIPRAEAHAAISALGRFYDPRRIRPGQAVTVTFRDAPIEPVEEGSRDDGSAAFIGLTVTIDYAKQVEVARTEDGNFSARQIEANLVRELHTVSGAIDSSLFEAAERQGVPLPVLINMIKAFSWDVDFQRDIQPGDSFEVMYERFRNDAGESVHEGRMVYANLTLQGKRKPIYLFTAEDGVEDYFDEDGKAARKALLRTPIDGARLTSGFGQRKHPILGYNRMHRGIDFAAPNGTPIYAAGDGVIDFAGPNSGYGRYIRIRHNDEYSTAYAHMSAFAASMMRGKRVRQGDVIGYVGTTGESTGPHLHYEILRQSEQINPMTVKVQAGRTLAGLDMKRFSTQRNAVHHELAAAQQERQFAADAGR